jgi:uncharacterized protein (TIGR02118 family)
MFTVMFVLHGREGMDQRGSLRHRRETHAPLVAKIPGVRRYVQFNAVGAPEGEAPFLGCATLEFDDEQAWQTAAESAEMATGVQDRKNFADPGRCPPPMWRP